MRGDGLPMGMGSERTRHVAAMHPEEEKAGRSMTTACRHISLRTGESVAVPMLPNEAAYSSLRRQGEQERAIPAH